MALSETYQCDVCGAKKAETDRWWLAWQDCLPDSEAGRPLLKLTAWHLEGAHSAGVIHLCGARCAGTYMDRWMTEQHENPDAQCVP